MAMVGQGVFESSVHYSISRVTVEPRSMPSAPTVTITPDPARTGDDLTATASGSTDPETLAREVLGVELSQPDFWLESIQVVDDDLERFESVVASL